MPSSRCLRTYSFFLFFLAGFATEARSQGSQYFFPQVVDGQGGGISYTTSFLLNNVQSASSTVTVFFYRSLDGSPWVIDLQSHDRPDVIGRRSSVTFSLAAGETVNLYTGGVDPQAVGWAKVVSSKPLTASEVFTQVDTRANPALVTWEAGVLGSPVANRFSFEANVSRDESVAGYDVNTGYAIVNPNTTSASITVTLYSRTGTLLGQKTKSLAPNCHTAEFVNQLFSDLQLPSRFHGILRFSSNVGIALCVLRMSSSTTHGDVFSTVAASPDSTLGINVVFDLDPNGSTSTAQAISLPVEIFGTFNPPDEAGGLDSDYFSVSLLAGQTLYVTASCEALGSPGDSDVILRDSGGSQIIFYTTSVLNTRDIIRAVTVSTAGTYYVQHVAHDSASSGRGSFYRLNLFAK